MFSQFDSLSIPAHLTPFQIPSLLQSVVGENNYLFIVLVVAEVVNAVALGCIVRAWKTKRRREILYVLIPVGVLALMLCVCLAVGNVLYGERLPASLNSPVTMQLIQNGQQANVTAKPTAVGINFSTGNGISLLGTTVALTLLAVVVNVRWAFEGITRSVSISEIRFIL